MTPEELEAWAEDFEAFHARFAHLFARSEPRGSVPVKCCCAQARPDVNVLAHKQSPAG